jgi:hypothetical protein
MIHQDFEEVQVTAVDAVFRGRIGILAAQARQIEHWNAVLAVDHTFLPFVPGIRYLGIRYLGIRAL